MPSLKNSHINPETVDSEFAQKEVNAEGTKALIAGLDERLRKWREFSDTEEAAVVKQLVDPEIALLNYQLGLSTTEIVKGYGVDPANVDEKRAEWRGARRIWARLKYAKDQLEARLKELGAPEEVETPKAKWRRISKKERKKFLTETE